MGLKKCELCGRLYVEGNPADEQEHSDGEHRYLMEALVPRASTELKEAYKRNSNIIWVDRDAPDWLRAEIYWRAKVFRREFGYDVPQWEVEGRHDPEAIGYVFRDDDFRIIGACCFRPDRSSSERMLLDWIWLCPSVRRTGVVSRHWDEFRTRFGDFSIGGPVSPAMSKFLQEYFPDHPIKRNYVNPPRISMEQFCQGA